MRRRLTYALFGVLATLVGVATGHFVASLLNPASSPVLAVGSQVIDLTPVSLKEYAIRTFGSNDKRVLIGSVMGGVLVLAAVAGLLARRRFVLGAGLQVVLVVVAGFTAMNRPTAEVSDLVPSLATALAGVGSLWWLDRSYRRAALTSPATAPTTAPTTSESTGDVVEGGPATMIPGGSSPSRRGVLVAGGVLAVAAAAMGGAGRLIGKYRARLTDIAFPKPAEPAPPFPVGIEKQYPASRRSG